MNVTDPQQLERMVRAATECRLSAYAPYSGYAVGADVLDEQDRIFTGCNVENSSFGLTMCAERVAVGTAIAAGSRSIRCVVVVSPGGVAPCGACRQILHEFSDGGEVVLVDSSSGQSRHLDQAGLLPEAFLFDDRNLHEGESDAD